MHEAPELARSPPAHSFSRLGEAVALMLTVVLNGLGYQQEGESMEQEHEGDGVGADT